MTRIAEIRFTTSTKGSRRAFRWDRMQQRFFPIPLADAELRIATGTGEDITEAYAAKGMWL